MYVYHVFFIHLSAGGHLDWFNFLTIVTIVELNGNTPASLRYIIFGIYTQA